MLLLPLGMWVRLESSGDAAAPDLYFEAGSLTGGEAGSGGSTMRTLSSCQFKAGRLIAVALGEEKKQ